MGQVHEPMTPSVEEGPYPLPRIEGFCPACGEPEVNGKISHTDMCPFAGDDRVPEDANAVK